MRFAGSLPRVRRRGNTAPGAAFRQTLDDRSGSIRHQKILIALEREAGIAAVRRYRPSRPWSVGGLALAAAAGAMLTTGVLSSALGTGSDRAVAARIGRSAATALPAREARAAIPAAATATASSAPPPAGVWRIQVGAFRDTRAAEAHLRDLESAVPELAGLTASHELRGTVTRVRIGGIEDETAARALCSSILAGGADCFVVRPDS